MIFHSDKEHACPGSVDWQHRCWWLYVWLWFQLLPCLSYAITVCPDTPDTISLPRQWPAGHVTPDLSTSFSSHGMASSSSTLQKTTSFGSLSALIFTHTHTHYTHTHTYTHTTHIHYIHIHTYTLHTHYTYTQIAANRWICQDILDFAPMTLVLPI